ncbi:MAG: midcut-by-XrtH protein, partial [Isosphaeraceae bacterium]
MGGVTYTPTATATSGLTVSLTIDASSNGVCAISSGGVVSFTGAGTCTIDANQAGNANWSPAPQVQQAFGVGKGAQTISFGTPAPTGATVGGVTYTPTATATSGLTVSLTIDASSNGVCAIS